MISSNARVTSVTQYNKDDPVVEVDIEGIGITSDRKFALPLTASFSVAVAQQPRVGDILNVTITKD